MSSEEKSELRRFIKTEIAKQMNILLNAVTKNAQKNTEDISQLFPGGPTVTSRPLVLPYGFATRAPDGTTSFTARVGDHAGSRYVIGHRDASRPTLNQGETAVYNQAGLQIRLESENIRIGSETSSEPFVLGNILNDFLQSLISAINGHSHAAPGAPPSLIDIEAFDDLASEFLSNDAILSEVIKGE